jgi:hypothetical protein
MGFTRAEQTSIGESKGNITPNTVIKLMNPKTTTVKILNFNAKPKNKYSRPHMHIRPLTRVLMRAWSVRCTHSHSVTYP